MYNYSLLRSSERFFKLFCLASCPTSKYMYVKFKRWLWIVIGCILADLVKFTEYICIISRPNLFSQLNGILEINGLRFSSGLVYIYTVYAYIYANIGMCACAWQISNKVIICIYQIYVRMFVTFYSVSAFILWLNLIFPFHFDISKYRWFNQL